MNTAFSQNYILAKARAVWGKSLTAQNYNDLMSFHSVPEAADYLRSKTYYAPIFEGFTSGMIHRGQLEGLLHKDLFDKYMKFCNFGKAIGNNFYEFYILKNDISQLLQIMTYMNSGTMESYIYSLPVFYEEYSKLDLYKLSTVRMPEQLISSLDSTPYEKTVKKIFSRKYAYNFIIPAEIEFNNFLSEELVKILKLKKNEAQDNEIVKLFTLESDMRFLNGVYRLITFPDVPREFILKLTAAENSLLSRQTRVALSSAQTTEEFIKILSGTKYKKICDYAQTADFDDAVKRFEYETFAKQIRFSTDPNVVMYTFLYLTSNEINNIIHIIECIRYSLPSDTVRPMLNGIN